MTSRTSPGARSDAFAGAVGPSSSFHPFAKAPEGSPRDRRLHVGQVLLVQAVGRMGQAVGELPVVRADEQTLGVEIEATDREDPGLGRHEVDHGGPALGVPGGGDGARRLVEQVVDQVRPGGHRGPVDLDPVGLGVGAVAQRGAATVDPDPAGRDQLVARPAAADARSGEHLLEPLRLRAAHAQDRSGGVSGASARRPASSCSTTEASGTKAPSGGSSARRSRPSLSRNRSVVP